MNMIMMVIGMMIVIVMFTVLVMLAVMMTIMVAVMWMVMMTRVRSSPDGALPFALPPTENRLRHQQGQELHGGGGPLLGEHRADRL